MIYFDNAATSWPKPDVVPEAMLRFMREIGANPGRSSHRLANEAERVRFDARAAVAELFNLSDPLRVVFAANGTTALNLVMRGMLGAGDHVVTTGMEHNAVMRPLGALESVGVRHSAAPSRTDGTLDPAEIDKLIEPDTRLIVVNHASNVCGTILPIREIGAIAHDRGIPFLVDATQTAGVLPIDLARDNIDLLAFTGHKSLLGPTGTGGLAIHPEFDVELIEPIIQGGTGSFSEHEQHPRMLPDRLEAGTPNIVGLAGLAAGVHYLLECGTNTIHARERRLAAKLIDGLTRIDGVTVHGTRDASRQTAVVSCVIDGQPCGETAQTLDERFEIMCRPGLHCAPRAHQTMGTAPDGTVRLAPGWASTQSDVDAVLTAIRTLAEESARG